MSDLLISDEEAFEMDRKTTQRMASRQINKDAGQGAVLLGDGMELPVPGMREMPVG